MFQFFAALPRAFVPFVAVAASVFGLSRSASALDIAFNIRMPRPTTHLFEVEMRVTNATAAPTTEVALPVWTPGSYLLREFARNVQDFAPVDDQNKPLAFHKTSKNTWRIDTADKTAWTLRYRVYANTLKVQEAELTDAFAFWNNAALLFHIPGQLQTPATVTVAAPNNWKTATGLPPVAGQPGTFRAPDFDTLYDSPFVVGPTNEATFTAAGKPHRIVMVGTVGPNDAARLVAPVQKIVAAEAAMMNGLPYDNYTFLYLVRTGAGGGLEHRNSTAIGTGPDAFVLQGPYNDLLETTAHEYFHLWNVKRIKPDALGPFDYNAENYTRLLWVAEGITSYYETHFLRRAGLQSPDEYLGDLARQIASLESTPGRKQVSVEDASFDAWIRYYRPDENSGNVSVSYYTKGALLGLVLDLAIRQNTNGAKSLDDVMRTLYTDYALKNRNYTPQDFETVCQQIGGGTVLPRVFRDYVRGRNEIDFDAFLGYVGLRRAPLNNADPVPFLGGSYVKDPQGVLLRSVPSDTPAYDQGLSAGDVIVAVDDVRVSDPDVLQTRLYSHAPGDTVRVTLFRGDRILTVPVKLGNRPALAYRIVPVENPTDAQRALYQAWMGAPLGNRAR